MRSQDYELAYIYIISVLFRFAVVYKGDLFTISGKHCYFILSFEKKKTMTNLQSILEGVLHHIIYSRRG